MTVGNAGCCEVSDPHHSGSLRVHVIQWHAMEKDADLSLIKGSN